MNRVFMRVLTTQQQSRGFFSATQHTPTPQQFNHFLQHNKPFTPMPTTTTTNQFAAQQQFFTPQPTFRLMPQGQFNHFQPQQMTFSEQIENVFEFMNRNKRKPKKANHGARPCSSVSRSKKKLRRHHYPK